MRGMKKNLKALGRLLKEPGAQAIFSSLLPFLGNDVGHNRRIQSINAWLCDWCYRQGFGFFYNGWFYKTPGLTVIRKKGLSQRPESSEAGISRAYLESFKLDLKGDGAVSGLAPVGQHYSIEEAPGSLSPS